MKPFLKTNKQTNKTNTDHLTSRQASFESVLSLLSSFFLPKSEDAFMKWIERALGDRKLRGDMMRWRKEWKMLVEKGEHMSALLWGDFSALPCALYWGLHLLVVWPPLIIHWAILGAFHFLVVLRIDSPRARMHTHYTHSLSTFPISNFFNALVTCLGAKIPCFHSRIFLFFHS